MKRPHGNTRVYGAVDHFTIRWFLSRADRDQALASTLARYSGQVCCLSERVYPTQGRVSWLAGMKIEGCES